MTQKNKFEENNTLKNFEHAFLNTSKNFGPRSKMFRRSRWTGHSSVKSHTGCHSLKCTFGEKENFQYYRRFLSLHI